MPTFSTLRVKGSVHDLEHLRTLQTDDCNVLLVSSRSLAVLRDLVNKDGAFETRYATEFIGPDLYRSVETDADVEDVVDIANSLVLEVSPVTCDIADTIAALTAAINGLSSTQCGCDVGTDTDAESGVEGGTPPGEVDGVPYTEPDPIVDRKCKAANYLHGSAKSAVNELNLNRVDTYVYAGVAVMVTLVATIVSSAFLGPFGLLIGAVIGSYLGMATLLFKGQVSLGDLYTAMTADEAALICALYESENADAARTAYNAILTTEGASAIELEFMGWMLSNNALNLLFFEWGDSADAIDNATIIHDCSECCDPEQGIFALIRGVVTSGSLNVDGVPFTITSNFAGGADALYFTITAPVGCPCVNYDIEVVSTGGPIGGYPGGVIKNCAGTDIWRYDVQGYGALIGTWLSRYVFLFGSGEFTTTFSITIP